MLLNDEAIRGLGLVTYDENGDISDVDIEGIAKAQLREVVEELKKEDARMYTGALDNPDMVIVKLHKDFWQSLLDEVKE